MGSRRAPRQVLDRQCRRCAKCRERFDNERALPVGEILGIGEHVKLFTIVPVAARDDREAHESVRRQDIKPANDASGFYRTGNAIQELLVGWLVSPPPSTSTRSTNGDHTCPSERLERRR